MAARREDAFVTTGNVEYHFEERLSQHVRSC